MSVNCKHFIKKGKGCNINKGWGWRRQFCGAHYLGEKCENIEKVIRRRNHEDIQDNEV